MPIEKVGTALLALKAAQPKKPAAKPAAAPAGGKKKPKKPGLELAEAAVASPAAVAAAQPFDEITPVFQPPGSQLCWAACAVMVADFLGVAPVPTIQSVMNNTPGASFGTPMSVPAQQTMYRNGGTGRGIDCVTLGVATQPQLDGALDDPNVVVVGVLWNGGGGHVVVVVGSDPSPQTGETFYYVNDPDGNVREWTVTYQGLLKARGLGNWHETIGRFQLT